MFFKSVFFVLFTTNTWFSQGFQNSDCEYYAKLLDDPFDTTFPAPTGAQLLRSFSRNGRPFALQMSNVRKFGLPKCGKKHNHCQTIGIVGAGASGLYAGILLAEAGHTVRIYEANNRAGGRVYTYRDPSNPSLYQGDFGAMRLPLSLQPYVNHLVRERYNLTIDEFYDSSNSGHVYIKGISTNFRDLNKNLGIFGFNLSESEMNKSVDTLWEDAFEPIFTTLEKGGWPAVRDKWDSFSINSYLRLQNLSLTAIDYMRISRGQETYGFVSILESFISRIVFNSGATFYKIRGGTDMLIQAMVAHCQQIPDNRCSIAFSTPVTQIQIFDSNHVRWQIKNGTNEIFDSVIVAVTPPATEFIKFERRADFIEKLYAIRQVNFACSVKVLLFFNVSWWYENESLGGTFSITDLPIRSTYYPKTRNGGTIIASYAVSTISSIWRSLPESEVLELVLRQVIESHPSSLKIREYFQGGKAHYWCDDSFAHMAFTQNIPFQFTNQYALLQKPVLNVYFIGEHTSLPHGWIESAASSAVRGVLSLTQQSETIVDVIIVGSDPLGLLTAFMLSVKRPDLSIIITQRNSINEWNVTKQQQFRQLFENEFLVNLANSSFSLWRDFENNTNQTVGSVLNTNNGYLFLADCNSTLLTFIQNSCKQFHLDCKYLTNVELEKRYPSLNFLHKQSAVFHNRSGYVNTTALMAALLKSLHENPKVIIREYEEILSIELYHNQVRLVTNRGVLHASDKVILIHDLSDKSTEQLLNINLNFSYRNSSLFHFNRLTNNQSLPSWMLINREKCDPIISEVTTVDTTLENILISSSFSKYPSNQMINVSLTKEFIDWIARNMSGFVNVSNFMVTHEAIIPEDIFHRQIPLDFVPNTNRRILMSVSGVSMTFLPVLADIISDVTLNRVNQSSRYFNYTSRFSLFNAQERNDTTVQTTKQSSTTTKTNQSPILQPLIFIFIFPLISILTGSIF